MNPAVYEEVAKRCALIFAFFVIIATADAAETCKDTTIEKTVNLLTDTYMKKRMDLLDGMLHKDEMVQFVVEHSITLDYEVEEAQTFSQAETWLNKLDYETGIVTREVRPLAWCRKGLCVFDFEEGISHNTLYIQKVTYHYKNGCPYFRTVFLLNGD